MVKKETIQNAKKLILKLLKDKENLALSAIAQDINKNYRIAKFAILELEKKNKVEKLPNTKYWRLKKSLK